LGAEGERYLGFLTDGASRMQELIDELLRYSRVQPPNATTRSREALAPLAQRAMKRLQASIDESGAEVVIGELPTLDVAPGYIVQVFQNLISNSIKFRGQTTPRIHISSRRADGGWVISVADNGIGIDARFFPRIFLVFQRLHTRDEFEGTGVGLAIVKRIVEQHQGKVWVESEVGRGSTFHFSLPDDPRPSFDASLRPPGDMGLFEP
ncbi:MAG: ATP-binding protein, partial [Myxococcota bacterium]